MRASSPGAASPIRSAGIAMLAVVMIAAAFSAFRNLPLALIGSAAPLDSCNDLFGAGHLRHGVRTDEARGLHAWQPRGGEPVDELCAELRGERVTVNFPPDSQLPGWSAFGRVVRPRAHYAKFADDCAPRFRRVQRPYRTGDPHQRRGGDRTSPGREPLE